jgi:hypothetical protein
MSEKPNEEEVKKGWWKRQTKTAKILLSFFIILIIGITAIVALAMSEPTYTALNVSAIVNDNFTTLDQSNITGTTEPGATVTVNNISVEPDSTGKFSYIIKNIVVGTQDVTVIAKSRGKEPTIAILELKRGNSNGAYTLSTQLINETNMNITG